MERIRRKKNYYVPGTISLIMLPILFIPFAQRELKNKINNVLVIRMLDTISSKYYLENPFIIKIGIPPKRQYIQIDCTGNNEQDKIKLAFAQIRIREIIAHNDFTNGVHIKFKDSVNYWAFVKAFDILTLEKAKRYLPINDDIWFFQIPPDTTNKIETDFVLPYL